MKALPILVAAVLACALVGGYVALGGTSFEPSPVADPCAPRPPRETEDTGERIEVVLLAAADGTACRLGVSREELVLALRSVDDLEEALRSGLGRAVDEGETQGLIGGGTASGLRFAADHLPLGLLLSVLRGASSLIG